jgi:hypothetical protein
VKKPALLLVVGDLVWRDGEVWCVQENEHRLVIVLGGGAVAAPLGYNLNMSSVVLKLYRPYDRTRTLMIETMRANTSIGLATSQALGEPECCDGFNAEVCWDATNCKGCVTCGKHHSQDIPDGPCCPGMEPRCPTCGERFPHTCSGS